MSSKVLKQITIVGGNLHHRTRLIEPEAFDCGLCERTGVFNPGGGVRGEVRVVGKDALGSFIRFELHQETTVADESTNWIKLLHLKELVGRKVGVREWRHSQIDEDVRKRRATESAAGLCHESNYRSELAAW